WLEATDAQLRLLAETPDAFGTYSDYVRTETFSGQGSRTYIKSDYHSQTISLSGNLSAKKIEGVTSVGSKNSGDIYNFFYTRNTFTLSFNTMGGNAIQSIPGVKFGEDLNALMPADPTWPDNKVLSSFQGWFYDAEYYRPFADEDNASPTMPNSNLQLFARWMTGNLTVTYYKNASLAEDALVDTKYVAAGKAVSASDVYEVGKGYDGLGTFLGWYWRIENTNVDFAYSFSIPVNKDLQLFAKWGTEDFSLTYHEGLGSGNVPTDENLYNMSTLARVQSGAGLTGPDDKLFYGWTKLGDTSGLVYYENNLIPLYGDTVLVAQYASQGELIQIIYNANAPSGVALVENTPFRVNAMKGSTVKLASGGFTDATGNLQLVGWSTTPDSTEPEFRFGAEHTLGETNLVLYGVWNTRSYTVSFKADPNGFLESPNGIFSFSPIAQGTLWADALSEDDGTDGGIVIPTAKPYFPEQYYFAGWEPVLPNGNEPITRDLVFEARFEQKQDVPTGPDGFNLTGAHITYDSTTIFAALGTGTLTDAQVAGFEVRYATTNDALTDWENAPTDIRNDALGLTDAGSKTIYARITGKGENANIYNPTVISAELIVDPITFSIVLANDEKEFGTADPVWADWANVAGNVTILDGAGTQSTLGALMPGSEGLNLSMMGARAGAGTWAGEQVKAYERAITASYTLTGGASKGNYNITVVPGNFTITRSTATITVAPQELIAMYDRTEHATGTSRYTIDGLEAIQTATGLAIVADIATTGHTSTNVTTADETITIATARFYVEVAGEQQDVTEWLTVDATATAIFRVTP
ncbi:hypothetical protein LJC04_06850, partial [Ruminococcaceae bacterium OttesenSCG-928-O06]|nr:hypothetical protein [Ruminococcaceae bacterium OttesenSCG-928-O06]